MAESIISGLKKGWTSLRTSLADWLRSTADAMDSDLGLWLWALVGAALLVVIGGVIWIF